MHPEIRWLPMILGLIVALKAPLFALLITPGGPSGRGTGSAAGGEHRRGGHGQG
jgi:hypothetical protein